MTTTSITLEQSEWTQVTTGSQFGNIYCGEIGATIIFTEAQTLPTTSSSETPISNALKSPGSVTYYGLNTSTNVYAQPANRTVQISVTPKSVE